MTTSTLTAVREILAPAGFQGDANIQVRHAAEKASWIWHPHRSPLETAVLRFTLKFTTAAPTSALLHVTADQRFQLRCDGQEVSFGPDRGDVEHWTVQTIRLTLTAGEHELESIVWHIADPWGRVARVDGKEPWPPPPGPPMAQMSLRGGFLLQSDDLPITTGQAAWQVEDLTDAVAMVRPSLRFYIDIGPEFTFDVTRWFNGSPTDAGVMTGPLNPNFCGVARPGWQLYPADMPEQRRESWVGGRVRAVRSVPDDDVPWQESAAHVEPWQALVSQNKPVTIPARSSVSVLWDFEDYICGYPIVTTQKGTGATITWTWAEGLYQAEHPNTVNGGTHKGNRGEINGKVFTGYGDAWRLGSRITTNELPALWWRSGRYVRLRITTQDEPVTITRLGVRTTGYPLDRQGKATWKSSDAAWDRLFPIFERAYLAGAHESWVDCPYYEQLSYVGDDRLHMLGNYACFVDDRVTRRCIKLFEWSRRTSASGLVAERYPSAHRQESPTYCLIWPWTVRDFLYWRDDADFVRSMLPGVRGVMDEFEAISAGKPLLGKVPGWPFVDWVPGWKAGCGPGVWEGDSSIVNLHYVLALQAAAEIENAVGDQAMAHMYLRRAKWVMQHVVERYWDSSRDLLLDTKGVEAASEHAQMFALLTGWLDEQKAQACLAALEGAEELKLARATIYASFYVLDALHRFGREQEFHKRLEFWRSLPEQGFTSMPEMPEPSRSDSHAWGAHPAYHSLASIAGVRPDGPSFKKVRITPMPGPLTHFEASVVHPRGRVEVKFAREGAKCAFDVTLPEGVEGHIFYLNQGATIRGGTNRWVMG